MVWAWCRREECTVSTSRSSFSPTPPKSSSKSSAPTICPPNGNPGGLLWRPAADTTAQRHLDLVVVVAHLVILVSLGLSHLLLVEVISSSSAGGVPGTCQDPSSDSAETSIAAKAEGRPGFQPTLPTLSDPLCG